MLSSALAKAKAPARRLPERRPFSSERIKEAEHEFSDEEVGPTGIPPDGNRWPYAGALYPNNMTPLASHAASAPSSGKITWPSSSSSPERHAHFDEAGTGSAERGGERGPQEMEMEMEEEEEAEDAEDEEDERPDQWPQGGEALRRQQQRADRAGARRSDSAHRLQQQFSEYEVGGWASKGSMEQACLQGWAAHEAAQHEAAKWASRMQAWQGVGSAQLQAMMAKAGALREAAFGGREAQQPIAPSDPHARRSEKKPGQDVNLKNRPKWLPYDAARISAERAALIGYPPPPPPQPERPLTVSRKPSPNGWLDGKGGRRITPTGQVDTFCRPMALSTGRQLLKQAPITSSAASVPQHLAHSRSAAALTPAPESRPYGVSPHVASTASIAPSELLPRALSFGSVAPSHRAAPSQRMRPARSEAVLYRSKAGPNTPFWWELVAPPPPPPPPPRGNEPTRSKRIIV